VRRYFPGEIAITLLNITGISVAFALIFQGGFAGAAVAQALRDWVARGIFLNEAGLGVQSVLAPGAGGRLPIVLAFQEAAQHPAR
jgi:AGCS family alanine or glycine:cation symporter